MTTFDKWYKNNMESQQEEPPEALWDAIQNDLDVEQVWARLDHALPLNKKRPIYGILAVAASLALLISAGLWMFNRPEQRTRDFSLSSMTEQALTPMERLAYKPLNTYFAGNIMPRESLVPTPTSPLLQTHTPASTISHLYIHRPFAAYLYPLETDRTALLAARSIQPTDKQIYSDIDIPDHSWQREAIWQVGVTGQLANTWMVNTKTIEGLQSDNLTTTNATFGNSIGLHVTWLASPRMKIKNEWHVLSRTGQSYHEYINGQYVTTSLDLNYINTALLFYYHPLNNKPYHSIALGLYSGMLQEATRQKNGDMERITGDYANFDFGLLLGYEYEHRIAKGLSLGSGIYTRYGLTNIFAGNQIVPAYLNQTRNAAFLLSFSVNYQLN
jgi:hypothetical protein